VFIAFTHKKRLSTGWGWSYTLVDSEFEETSGEVDTAWHLGIPVFIKEYEKRNLDPTPSIVRVILDACPKYGIDILETERIFTQCLPIYETYRQNVREHLAPYLLLL
jgi:hypothetical protein